MFLVVALIFGTKWNVNAPIKCLLITIWPGWMSNDSYWKLYYLWTFNVNFVEMTSLTQVLWKVLRKC